MGSNAGDIKAGQAYVELYADKEQMRKDLDEAEGLVAKTGVVVTGTATAIAADLADGAVAVGALLAAGSKKVAAAGNVAVGAFRTVGQVGQSAIATVAATLDASSQKLKSWGSAVGGAGATLLAAGGAIKGVLGAGLAVFQEMGSKLKELSDRTGVSAEALSTLSYAVTQAGVSVDSLESALVALRKNLSGTSDSSKEAQAALAQLGISAADLAGKSPDEQFRRIAAQLARVADPAQRAAGALKIFGSAGESLLPVLSKGSEYFKTMEQRARDLGLEISSKDAAAAEALKTALAELWATVKMVSFAIGAPLADSFREIVQLGTDVVSRVLKWVKENGHLVVGANMLANALLIAGGALAGFGALLSAAGAAIGYITATVAALLSPVALTIAAVAGLGYAFVQYTATGQAALVALVDTFNMVKTDGVQAFQAISNALSAGDLEAAVKVATTLLMLEWTKAIQFINEKWLSFKTTALTVAIDLGAGIARAFIDAFAVVKRELVLALTEFKKLELALDPTKSPAERKAASDLLDVGAKFGTAAINTGRDAQKKALDDKAAGLKDDVQKGADAAAAAAVDEVPGRQKDFDDAVAAALAAKKKPTAPGASPLNTNFSAAAATAGKAAGGIGSEDVRSREGFKAVAAALRIGRDDSGKKAVDILMQMKAQQDRQYIVERDMRDQWAGIARKDFKNG